MVDNGLSDESIEVSDDEQYTDKKIKARILNAREMLNDAQHELYSKRLVDPDVQYSELDALLAWGNLVRSYIRDLSILLNHPDMPKAQHYREEVKLAEIHLIPPDKHGYPFSQIVHDEIDEEDLVIQMDGFERGAELPKPKTQTIHGLMSLVEAEPVVEAHWVVTQNPRAARPNRKQIKLTAQRPIPRNVYEQALVEADQFLQQSGIGLDIAATDYMGEGEPGL